MNKVLRNTLLALALSAVAHGALADALTDRAKALLDDGKAKEAYSLLEPQEGVRAGDPSFDLLFGIAAVDIGQNTRGVFALERVLAVQPDNALARAEIARAYMLLGETDTAKREFDTVQKQPVSPEVSARINRILDAVDRLGSVSLTTLGGYVEGSFGYDNNINAATNKGSVAIPVFGGLPFTLANDSRANSAWFATVGGGVNLRSPINRDVAFVAGLSGSYRDNFGSNTFDNLNADAYAGLVITQDKDVFSVNAQFNQYDLQSDGYRTAAGLSGQWQRNIDARNQVSAYLQYSDLRYQQEGMDIRNANRWVAGGAYAHAYRGGEVAFASGYLVSERPRDNDAKSLGFEGVGVRLGGQMNWDGKTVLFAGGSIEYRRYSAEDVTFLTTRKDTQYDLVVGAHYVPERNWRITPRLTLTNNDSNTVINKYHREAVSVTVRRDF